MPGIRPDQAAAGTSERFRARDRVGAGLPAAPLTSAAAPFASRVVAADWRAFALAAAALSLSRRFFSSSRIMIWAAFATAGRADSGTESNAWKNAWLTVRVPRGARVLAVVFAALAILVITPSHHPALFGRAVTPEQTPEVRQEWIRTAKKTRFGRELRMFQACLHEDPSRISNENCLQDTRPSWRVR
ncbi:MAG: hypothetical protein JOZ05_22690 [Acetobacteraceae bacterium]|nr:hypothetical protein [Acetobacteraceae bacterium]